MVSIGGLDRTIILWDIKGRPSDKDKGRYMQE